MWRDPIGYRDGENVYLYVRNKPITEIDVYGMWHLAGDTYGMWLLAAHDSVLPVRQVLRLLYPQYNKELLINVGIDASSSESDYSIYTSQAQRDLLDRSVGTMVKFKVNNSEHNYCCVKEGWKQLVKTESTGFVDNVNNLMRNVKNFVYGHFGNDQNDYLSSTFQWDNQEHIAGMWYNEHQDEKKKREPRKTLNDFPSRPISDVLSFHMKQTFISAYICERQDLSQKVLFRVDWVSDVRVDILGFPPKKHIFVTSGGYAKVLP